MVMLHNSNNPLLRSFRLRKERKEQHQRAVGAGKYKFVLHLKELLIEYREDAEADLVEAGGNPSRPSRIVVACVHRSHRVVSREKLMEVANPEQQESQSSNRYLVTWAGAAAAESLEFETNLHPLHPPTKVQSPSSLHGSITQPGDEASASVTDTAPLSNIDTNGLKPKEWTLLVERLNAKGRHRPLAAISINFPLFISASEGGRIEVKFKLRTLCSELRLCTLKLHIQTFRVNKIAGGTTAASGKRRGVEAGVNEGLQFSYPPLDAGLLPVEVAVKGPVDKESSAIAQPPIGSEASPGEKASKQTERPGVLLENGGAIATQAAADFKDSTATRLGGGISPEVPLALATQQPSTPEILPGEGLLEWTQRVTEGYKGVRIVDYTRSWRSGLAFCALLHRYRPALMGDYGQLNFTNSSKGHEENCQVAFEAAEELGIPRLLDAGETVTLPNRRQVERYLGSMRAVLEGVAPINDEVASPSSEQRISAAYALNEQDEKQPCEVQVIKSLEILQKSRGKGGNEKEWRQKHGAKLESHTAGASKPAGVAAPGKASVNTTTSSPTPTAGASKKVPVEAATLGKASVNQPSSLQLPAVGKNPQREDHNKAKQTKTRPPKPRKKNGTPPGQVPNNSKRATSVDDEIAALGKNALDRVKRFGSTRARVLANNIGLYKDSLSTSATKEMNVLMTPTRKLITDSERNINASADDVTRKQGEINEKIDELEGLNKQLRERMASAEEGSAEEQELLAEQISLTEERNRLVWLMDYWNMVGELKETEEEINVANRHLAAALDADGQVGNMPDYAAKLTSSSGGALGTGTPPPGRGI